MAKFKLAICIALVSMAAMSGCKKKNKEGSSSPTPGPSASPSPSPVQTERYPGAPAACQPLEFHTHGSCFDARNTDGGVEAYDWTFYAPLQDAINNVPRTDLTDETGGIIRGKEGVYGARLGAYLNDRGICGVVASERTIYMRSANDDSSEEIEFLNGRTRRPTTYGNVQCAPAGAMPGTVRSFGCNIPDIPNKTCVNPQQRYQGLVTSVIKEIIAEERPKGNASKLIDFNFSPTNPDDVGVMLKDDGVSFMWKVAEKIGARGYCAWHDNWKHVRVRDTEFEEEVGIITSTVIPGRNSAQDQACIDHGFTDNTCEFAYVKVMETCKKP